MRALKFYEKQPAEIQDYWVDYSRWLTAVDDAASSHTASVENVTPGAISPDDDMTLVMSAISSNSVVARCSGGKHGMVYKLTTTMTSANGLVKESDVMIRVIEV